MKSREEILAEMQEDFEKMTEKQRDENLYTARGKVMTPRVLLEEAKNDTEIGKAFISQWEIGTQHDKEVEAFLIEKFGFDPTKGLIGTDLPLGISVREILDLYDENGHRKDN